MQIISIICQYINRNDVDAFHKFILEKRNVFDINSHVPTTLYPNLSPRNTLLHVACQQGRLEIVKILLTLGIDYQAYNGAGFNALHKASLEGHSDIVDVLLKHDRLNIEYSCDLNKNKNLRNKVQKSNSRKENLLNNKLNINPTTFDFVNSRTQTSRKTTALMQATGYGHSEVVRVLLDYGADPLLPDEDGLSTVERINDDSLRYVFDIHWSILQNSMKRISLIGSYFGEQMSELMGSISVFNQDSSYTLDREIPKSLHIIQQQLLQNQRNIRLASEVERMSLRIVSFWKENSNIYNEWFNLTSVETKSNLFSYCKDKQLKFDLDTYHWASEEYFQVFVPELQDILSFSKDPDAFYILIESFLTMTDIRHAEFIYNESNLYFEDRLLSKDSIDIDILCRKFSIAMFITRFIQKFEKIDKKIFISNIINMTSSEFVQDKDLQNDEHFLEKEDTTYASKEYDHLHNEKSPVYQNSSKDPYHSRNESHLTDNSETVTIKISKSSLASSKSHFSDSSHEALEEQNLSSYIEEINSEKSKFDENTIDPNESNHDITTPEKQIFSIKATPYTNVYASNDSSEEINHTEKYSTDSIDKNELNEDINNSLDTSSIEKPYQQEVFYENNIQEILIYSNDMETISTSPQNNEFDTITNKSKINEKKFDNQVNKSKKVEFNNDEHSNSKQKNISHSNEDIHSFRQSPLDLFKKASLSKSQEFVPPPLILTFTSKLSETQEKTNNSLEIEIQEDNEDLNNNNNIIESISHVNETFNLEENTSTLSESFENEENSNELHSNYIPIGCTDPISNIEVDDYTNDKYVWRENDSNQNDTQKISDLNSENIILEQSPSVIYENENVENLLKNNILNIDEFAGENCNEFDGENCDEFDGEGEYNVIVDDEGEDSESTQDQLSEAISDASINANDLIKKEIQFPVNPYLISNFRLSYKEKISFSHYLKKYGIEEAFKMFNFSQVNEFKSNETNDIPKHPYEKKLSEYLKVYCKEV